MQNILTKKNVLLFLVFFIALALTGFAVASEEKSESGNTVAGLDATDTKDNFYEYRTENRSDPFRPFLREQTITTKESILDVDPSQLTGLQKLEPGQLNLVAIMYSGESKMAMVEDVTGQGYMLNEGDLIGRRGVVSEIKYDQVVITEIAKTTSGKELVSTIIMRMGKEGEK